MREVPLLTVLLLGVALPLHAEPPSPPAHAAATPSAPTHAPRSRIGEVMGSLTQALHDAAEQQSHASAAPPSPQAAPSPGASSQASLPPDATAQATVP